MYLLILIAFLTNPQWVEIFQEDEVTVYKAEVPGRSLPVYKAVGILDANMCEILAILNDFDRHKEWIYPNTTSETRLVWRPDDFNFIMYGRFDAPFPVMDRDGIISVAIEYNRETKEMRALAERITLEQVPVFQDVIRVPRARITAHLKYLGPNRTLAMGTMDVDPGGDIPHWIVEFFSQSILSTVLSKLNKQINKTKGEYDDFIMKYCGPGG